MCLEFKFYFYQTDGTDHTNKCSVAIHMQSDELYVGLCLDTSKSS